MSYITRFILDPQSGLCIMTGEGSPDNLYNAPTGSQWIDRLTGGKYTKTAFDETSWDEITAGSPAASYATWDPANKAAGMVLSNGNLTSDGSGGGIVRSTVGKSSGKWYWEITPGATPERALGICNGSFSVSSDLGASSNSFAYYGGDGGTYPGGTGYGATFGGGDVISVALDMDSGKIWFAKNGTWQASGNPGTGSNPATTGLTGTYYAAIGGGDNGEATANFGASSFSYAPPTGFSGLTA
jgi:hypothetical protein